MAKWDTSPEIVSMALALKLDPRVGAVQEIIRYCEERIAGFVARAGSICSLKALEELVCQNLHLVIEEIWSDEDLQQVIRKYMAKGETAFASLTMQLEGDTFGALMERHQIKAGASDRYVAIIDCRGAKGARRFFTRWHEIAHVLTLVTQLELPFHRSTSTKQDPLERLMDTIAGEVAFYDPLFVPALNAELKTTGWLTFAGVERVRDSICPEASFQSTLIACAKRTATPVIQVEARVEYKKAEKTEMELRQSHMFPHTKPEPKLRAVNAVPNEAARERGFIVHKNMQIPAESLIAVHFHETEGTDASLGIAGIEDFSTWRHSDGTTLGQGKIRVEVRRLAATLLAIIQPT